MAARCEESIKMTAASRIVTACHRDRASSDEIAGEEKAAEGWYVDGEVGRAAIRPVIVDIDEQDGMSRQGAAGDLEQRCVVDAGNEYPVDGDGEVAEIVGTA